MIRDDERTCSSSMTSFQKWWKMMPKTADATMNQPKCVTTDGGQRWLVLCRRIAPSDSRQTFIVENNGDKSNYRSSSLWMALPTFGHLKWSARMGWRTISRFEVVWMETLLSALWIRSAAMSPNVLDYSFLFQIASQVDYIVRVCFFASYKHTHTQIITFLNGNFSSSRWSCNFVSLLFSTRPLPPTFHVVCLLQCDLILISAYVAYSVCSNFDSFFASRSAVPFAIFLDFFETLRYVFHSLCIAVCMWVSAFALHVAPAVIYRLLSTSHSTHTHTRTITNFG